MVRHAKTGQGKAVGGFRVETEEESFAYVIYNRVHGQNGRRGSRYPLLPHYPVLS